MQADIASVEDVATALPKAEPCGDGRSAEARTPSRIASSTPDPISPDRVADPRCPRRHRRQRRVRAFAQPPGTGRHRRDGSLCCPIRRARSPSSTRRFMRRFRRKRSRLSRPLRMEEQGIRRYGFHGINHAHVSRRAPEMLQRPPELRLITCHLGNGCSLAAIRGGKSIDTTMGFTPADGLMMGSRCGSLDPGIVVYLLRHAGYTADQFDRIFNRESGLEGDLRSLRRYARSSAPPWPRETRAPSSPSIFTRIAWPAKPAPCWPCSEGSTRWCSPEDRRTLRPFARAAVHAARLPRPETGYPKNGQARADMEISSAESSVRVLVIGADEELEMARECARLAPGLTGTRGASSASK